MKENVALPSPSLSPGAVPAAHAAPIRRWPLLVGGGALLLSLVAAGVAAGAYSQWTSSQLIAPGVRIAGVPVGGLTQEQARDALQKKFGRLFVTLQTDERPFQVSLRELGGAPSIVPTVAKAAKIGRQGSALGNFLRVYGARATGESFMLPMVWKKSALVAKLKTVDHLYALAPRDARLQVRESGVQIVPGREGRALNVGATALQLQRKYFVGVPQLSAATRAVRPRIAAADLQGEDVLLASYPTRFNPGLEGRTTNIHVAAAAIDGTVLMPGETFSFNEHTGERTFDKGYRMAHIFERKPGAAEAEVVDGLAGGTCQVSSTLFNAVRRVNERVGTRRLKIVERNTHSLPVTYVPKGLDATVAWPYKDFRFRNAFDHPVYLRASVGRSRLNIGVWGRVTSDQAAPLIAQATDEASETSN